jgi:hypothetical protein
MLFIMVIFILPGALFAEETDTGWISGQFMIEDGAPMSDGMVVFFNDATGPPPDPDRYLRIPDEIGAIDAEGKFRVRLPSGRYYMGAVKRMSGEEIGPPQDGDYFLISRDLEGKPLSYVIEEGKSVSVGILSGAVPFKRKTAAAGMTGISGRIVELNGQPVNGAIVFAYFTETMTGLPPFTSYKTGKDGKYFISMNEGGQYYLRVRDIYGGGPPVPGAIMGGYGEEKPAAVTVKTGEISEEINIRVIRHLERGPKGKEKGSAAEQGGQKKSKKKMDGK